MKTWWLVMLALVAVLAIITPTAVIAQGKGHGKDKDHGNPHADRDRDDDRDRWERRGDYEYRTYGDRDDRPPGWSKGKKTGWGNCGLPPGQAKKTGECRTYSYQGRRHYYYRDDQGRIVVRRPVYPWQPAARENR